MDLSTIAQLLGLLLLALVVLAVVTMAVRRRALARTGGIDLSWRTDLRADGEGWTLGQGRFGKAELHLYKAFSPFPAASRRLSRRNLRLGDRRTAVGTEPDLLDPSAVIVRCTDGGPPFELAMTEQALTGLRSWLEALPPGSAAMGVPRRRAG